MVCITFFKMDIPNKMVSGMDSDGLKAKASELWEVIVKLETEKYDLEERQKRQDYDVSFDLQLFN